MHWPVMDGDRANHKESKRNKSERQDGEEYNDTRQAALPTRSIKIQSRLVERKGKKKKKIYSTQ